MVLSTKIRIMIYKHTSSSFKKTVAHHYREKIFFKKNHRIQQQHQRRIQATIKAKGPEAVVFDGSSWTMFFFSRTGMGFFYSLEDSLKIGFPKRKVVLEDYHFSGAMFNFWVCIHKQRKYNFK